MKVLLFYLKIPRNPFVLGKISCASFKSELPLGSLCKLVIPDESSIGGYSDSMLIAKFRKKAFLEVIEPSFIVSKNLEKILVL